jgi:hypothetical protein
MTKTDLETNKEVTNLAVIRINPKSIHRSCIIGEVKQNEEAQALADGLSNNMCEED